MVAEIAKAHPAVTGAIRNASRMTGANFQYLLATAKVESNLNPNAAGRTSTAKGLFQFIEQTWLATLKEQGPALGYGRYAQAIERTPAGQYAVRDPRAEAAILNLRSDPTANAVMAGAYTRENTDRLSSTLGRNPTEGELYIAHFLGAGGASRLIGLAGEAPRAVAAEQFPGAARANPSIFYTREGKARSVSQVYGVLTGRYDNAREQALPVQAPPVQSVQAPANRVPLPPVRAAYAPEPASLTASYAAAQRLSKIPQEPTAALGDTGPAFHSLFHTPGARRDPVSPVVSNLWGGAPAATGGKPSVVPEPAAAPPQPQPAAMPQGQPQPLDLFQENLPDARALFRGRV
jgi:hypothetical protein